MDRVYHLGEDVAIDRGGMEAEAGSCLFMFLLHSGNRERHACMPSVQLPFCSLIQPDTVNGALHFQVGSSYINEDNGENSHTCT